MRMNPAPVFMMIFAGLLGYLIGDVRGALTGVCISMGVSLVATFISKA